MRAKPDYISQEELLGAGAIKPPGWDRTGWETFRYFLHDPEKGTFLSRTPLSWLKISLFYTVYFSCLAGFWYGCLLIFFRTLPDLQTGPRWKQGASLIGVNPGVGLRPSNRDYRIGSSMLRLQWLDNNSVLTDPEGEGRYSQALLSFVESFASK